MAKLLRGEDVLAVAEGLYEVSQESMVIPQMDEDTALWVVQHVIKLLKLRGNIVPIEATHGNPLVVGY